MRVWNGRYLAIAADCMACHTAAGGKPYAGGYAIDSPLGTIYATNITPSKKGGIGHYTEADFARAARRRARRWQPSVPGHALHQLCAADGRGRGRPVLLLHAGGQARRRAGAPDGPAISLQCAVHAGLEHLVPRQ
jgi:hypothetical protein